MFLAPSASGQTPFFAKPGVGSPGCKTAAGNMVLSPVRESISLKTFCISISMENRYSPVVASIASKIAAFPPVTTALRISPLKGTSIICRSKAQSKSSKSLRTC